MSRRFHGSIFHDQRGLVNGPVWNDGVGRRICGRPERRLAVVEEIQFDGVDLGRDIAVKAL